MSRDYPFLQQKYMINTYVNRGVTFVEGKGVFLWDSEGSRYLDLMTNYGVNIFGYGHPAITRLIIRQLRRLPTLHGSFTNDTRAEAAQALVNRCGGGLSKVFFSNSGAEAVEAALKFAVLATGRKKIVACRQGYHGKTLGALSATFGEKYRDPFKSLLLDVRHISYNSLEELEAALDEETAAFIVEPVQGEGSIRMPDEGYLSTAAGVCRRRDVLLIVDEIQTGIGRTGKFLASQEEISAYDIVCLGKGLAGGIPVGATLVSSAVADAIPRGSHTSTFGGNPIAAAGVLGTLRKVDNFRLGRIERIGSYFKERLEQMDSPHRRAVHGKGLMLGFETTGQRDRILKNLQQENVLAIPAGENMVRFLPAFILERDHVDFAVEKLEKVLKEIQ